MRYQQCMAGLILVGTLFFGCSKESEKTTPPPTEGAVSDVEQPKAPSVTPATPPSTEQPAAAVPEVEEKASEAASEVANKAEEEGKEVATPAAEEAKTTDSTTQQVAKDAQSRLDQALEAVKNGKLDEAEKTITDLEGMVGSLPAPLPDRIAAARQALDAAKVAASAKSLVPK